MSESLEELFVSSSESTPLTVLLYEWVECQPLDPDNIEGVTL